MLDWQIRDQFDRVWKEKLKKSKYDLEDSMAIETFTSAKCKLNMTLTFRTQDNKIVGGKLRKKPTYTDSYGKARNRGYLVMEESPGEFFVAHIRQVYSRGE